MQKIKIFPFVLLLLLARTLSAQGLITPDEAVRAALQNHPLARAAALDVQAKKYAEKKALNLPNPEVNAESPTGEFYAVGVTQSFEFPTVYARQKQVAKAETSLAEAGRLVSENDLRFSVRSRYLEAQIAEYQSQQWAQRDTLYQDIAISAARQFEAGEIDFLQKTLAENEAGSVHQERLAAEQMAAAARRQLAMLTGLANLGALEPLKPETKDMALSTGLIANPSIAYEQQAAKVADQQASLAKSRALPNFSFGYLNQGARNTPLDYRFRASIGIPLWAGQYRASINAAEAESQAALARSEGQRQSVAMEIAKAQTEVVAATGHVNYYQEQALPRSRSMMETATRMFKAGQVDYVAYLRTLDQAYNIQRAYISQVQTLEMAHIKRLYLLGQ